MLEVRIRNHPSRSSLGQHGGFRVSLPLADSDAPQAVRRKTVPRQTRERGQSSPGEALLNNCAGTREVVKAAFPDWAWFMH